ncbi:hypothetical protein [Nocardia aurea]|uniref:hypothetical protein n=1 Tax=Nocardia aurea TaxID=2144174 RepID=UPI0033A0AB5F
MDPFEEHMTPENIEYVARSGKYAAFDVGSEFPYIDVLGATIDDVELMALPSGIVIRGFISDRTSHHLGTDHRRRVDRFVGVDTWRN